jgi:dienelactone hydrolase
MRPSTHRPARRAWLRHAALLLALGPALAVAATGEPMPAAPAVEAGAEAAYRTHDFDWFDAARGRAVPVRLYLPAGADAARPAPLVVFSHGIGGSRQGYSWLGAFWASRGYASLHLQHVGSDRSVWLGNPLDMLLRLQSAAREDEAIARVRDLSFALDRLLAGELAPRIDGRRIVAAGHSYGANTTLLAAGAQVRRDGQPVDLRDPRVRAAIVLSAPPFYGEGDPAPILAGVRVPSLHVTATEDVIRIPGYYSGAEDRVAVFDATGSARKALAVFGGGSHSIFTDRTGPGGPVLNAQVKQATRELSLAFLASVFDGDDAALRRWPAQFADIVARWVPAGR